MVIIQSTVVTKNESGSVKQVETGWEWMSFDVGVGLLFGRKLERLPVDATLRADFPLWVIS